MKILENVSKGDETIWIYSIISSFCLLKCRSGKKNYNYWESQYRIKPQLHGLYREIVNFVPPLLKWLQMKAYANHCCSK